MNDKTQPRRPRRAPDYRQHLAAALGVVVGMTFTTLCEVVAVIIEAVAS